MRKVSFLKRAMILTLAAILGFGPCIAELGTLEVQAATTVGSASYANDKSEVGGYWYYSVNGQQVENKNSDLLNKLPYEGSVYRYTTANYDANNGAFDTSNWATSFMWDLDGDNPYSSTVYAIPLAFRASVSGGATNVIQVTAPSRLSDTANNTYTMQMPSDGTLTDFFIQTSFKTSSAKVDAITDWTYDVVMENAEDATQYLKTTMVQGSIFAYFELHNDDNLTIARGRGLPAAVAYTNGAGNVIVIRCMDNMNNDYDYYAFYGAEGTIFDVATSGNMITSIAVRFPSENDAYMSLAYLGSTPGSPDDSWGASMCQAYLPYAYNFVINTTATFDYEPSTSTMTTVYEYEVNKKVAGAPDGTIMGVLPHQYKNIKAGTQFLDYTYETIRGTMKTIAGSSFTTELKYSGILPFMPDYSDNSTEETTLSTYLKDYTDAFSNDYFENYEGSGDTYWDGKGLNRLANAMAAAEAAGDVGLANSMYESLKNRLEEWFTYDGLEDTTYFYYDKGVGSMFGFPQSYDSVNQINDHHFHYGYFIYAAAQVALRDETGTWAEQYGSLVNELINDIACLTRNSAGSRYPYLRNFAPYEGHSWASGHANFDMGNNQESSSEALNAWAGIILWGEATGNEKIRDLGIYLYTTEISAVQNYWYDVDEDVLSDAYRYKVGANDIATVDKSTAKVENNSAAIVWGGSYTYATWFSANPLYIQGINLLPMNPTCFYLAGDADYIQQNWDLAYEKAAAAGWDLESWVDIWCQYYAMAFPEEALAQWKSVEEGDQSYGVEGGDTKAHTYHFIKSLCTYGTPDTSITSNATLSTVFIKDGVKTYIAYNATASDKAVTFSDGYQITVPANSMKVEKEGDAENQAKYTIQYYLENTSGDYVPDATQIKYGEVDAEVTVTAKEMVGYVYDAGKENVTSAIVKEDGSTVLKLYYKRATYNISYELNADDAVNPTDNPQTYRFKDSIVLLEPTRPGYNFTGWYKDAALTKKVTMIQDTDMGDITLYAGWQDPYVYQLDATKTLTYDEGVITITVSGVAKEGSNTVDVLWRICEESQVDNIVSGGASALTGQAATYDEATGTWIAQFTESNGVAAGKYFVFMVNAIRNNAGELSGSGVYEIPEASSSNNVTYYENYYQENLDGTFSLYESVKKRGAIGTEVTCTEKTYTGFVYDADNERNVGSGTLSADTTTTLARYYEREEYDITYHLNGGEATGNPDTYTYGETVTLNNPTQSGKTFIGWYTDEECTVSFAGIKATTTGDFNLYARWVDEGSEQVNYTVRHYKQTEEGSSEYVEDTDAAETLKGWVGTTVYATAKSFEGYAENASHGERVVSGLVKEDGSLELKLYYDIVTTGGDENTFGVTYDANTGKATFYYNGASGGIVYIKVCDNKETAQGYVEAANAKWPGFDAVPGHGGYPLTSGTNGAQYQLTVAEGKYLVYAFNPENKGVESWYLFETSAIETENAAEYTVKHYKQESTESTNYILADTEILQGEIGTTVTAAPKNYAGYKVNTEHAGSKVSGEVKEDGSLILELYYDVSDDASSGGDNGDSDYETPEGAGYTYDATTQKVTLFWEQATGGIAYLGVYSDKESAEEAAANANADLPGFGYVIHWSKALEAGDGRAECTFDATISEGQYIVYTMAAVGTNPAKWYVAKVTATQSGGDDTTQANYTVEHHKQQAEGSKVYIVEDTETLTGTVGSTVTAKAKTYTGYKENTTHRERVSSGIVQADGSLVLKVYYDVNLSSSTERAGRGAAIENGSIIAWLDDAPEGTSAVKFIAKVYDSKEEAEKRMEDSSDAGMPSYAMDADGDGTYSRTISEISSLSDTQYLLYQFYITPSGFTGWVLTTKAELEAAAGGGEVTPDPDPVEVTYTVKHYQQNADLNGYTIKDTETLKGNAGDSVEAVPKTYTGFTYNSRIEGTKLNGTLEEGTALELSVYYTRNSYNITYGNMDNATNATGNTATYIYGVGLILQAPTYADGSFTFGGWYEDAECTTTPITAIAADRTGDVDVYAKWVAVDISVSYTVEYYQQNTAQKGYDKVSSVTLSGEAGDDVTATINTYRGFTHNNQVEGTLLSGTLAKDEELVLKVYYDRNTYIITYNNMDGAINAEANNDKYIYGVGLTFRNPSKEGYTFEGWFTDADFDNPITAIGTDTIDNVTVYAKWTKTVTHADYVIKYYLETTTPNSYVEVIGDRMEGNDIVGKIITAEEKEYTGYQLNTAVEGSALSGALVANEVLTLKVFYDRCTYNITYYNIEDAVNPEENAPTYTYGTGFALLDASRTDYIFGGWYSDEECSADKRVTQITNLQTGDVELYAKWIKESANYTIRFYKQNKEQTGYEEVTQDTIVASNEVGTVIDAIAYGYGENYTGFELNENHEESCLSGTVSKTTPLILKLYYDRVSYNITYANMEGATNAEGNAATYVYGVGLTLQAPEKEGQIFAGWYLDSAFTEDKKIAAISTTLAKDVTVYAKWIDEAKVAAYTVYYYLQDMNLKDYTEVEADRFIGSGEVGVIVQASAKAYEGFELNTEAEGYLEAGKVLEDGSLELKLYYDRCAYDIIYHNIDDAVNPDTNTATYTYGIGLALGNPARGDYVFGGWYTNEGMAEEDRIVKISDTQTGEVNLYAKWTEYVAEEEVETEPDQSFTVDEIENQYYTGSKITPYVVVKDGDKILVEKKDYTLKFTNNLKAGIATVKITGKGNYSGTVERNFEIKRVDIGADDMTADDIYVDVNKSGKAIAVKPKLVWGKKTLKMNADYKILGDTSYSQPGTYEVTLEGIGNFEGTRTISFTIAEKQAVLMSKVKVGKIANQYYRNGAVIEPELKVTYKNVPLVEGVDYKTEYLNNTQAGTATVIITGTGDTYVGEKKVTFKIVGTALSKMGISLKQTEFEYTGDSIYPEYFSGDLKAGKDFTITYSGNRKVGKGTVTFTGIGAYTGTVKKTFKIVPYNIANNVENYFTDTTGEISVEYVKAGCTPKVEVRFRDVVLKEGTDYTLKYSQNKKVGTGTITVTGKGSYKGTYKKTFTIKKANLEDVLIIPTDIVEKSGKNASYYMTKVTLTDTSGKNLVAGTDYDKAFAYAYKNADGEWISFDKSSNIGNLKAGTVLRVTIKERQDGKGSFEGTVSAEYKVIAATGNIKSAKVKIKDKAYTGEAVVLTKDDFEYVTLNGTELKYGEHYEIVEDSYVKNTTKGTAKVTIRGIGAYGGTKTVTFKIGARSIKDIIAGIFKK